jgi:hypothetical protein
LYGHGTAVSSVYIIPIKIEFDINGDLRCSWGGSL